MNSLQQNERLYSAKTLSGLDPFTQVNDRLDIVDAEITVLQTGQFVTTGTVTLTGKVGSNATATSDTIIGEYDSTNHSDITGLTGGTASGTLVNSTAGGHLVMGLRADDATDSFSIVSTAGSSATAVFSKLLFNIVSGGTATFLGGISAASATLTGALSAASVTFTGLLTAAAATFSGLVTCNGSPTGIAVTNNATVGGTLGVTGNTTLSGTLGVTGNTTLSGTLGVTGNATVGGTLGITGNVTGTADGTFDQVFLRNATFANSNAAALVSLYASGQNTVSIQVKGSASGSGVTNGVLMGVNGTDLRLYNYESGDLTFFSSAGTYSGAFSKGRYQDQTGFVTPVGTVLPWAGKTASLPTGWLFCDGSSISRTTYSELFGIIGTNYGAGNGTTTFNIPDLRGRIPIGKDDMGGSVAGRITVAECGIDGTNLGAAGGEQSHQLVVSEMPSHTHGVQGTQTSYGTLSLPNAGATRNTISGSVGGNGTHNNVLPSLVVQYMIHY